MAHSFNNESPTINDLMKKSTEISSGPPAVRRLITTRSNLDESGKIRKWTFGQQNAKMQNKTILMVGETGTGKTTLINTMTNYYLGVKFEDKVWFEITEEQKKDQTESKTSEITVYEIISEQISESLTIIDTPRIDKDMKISLCKLFLHETGVKSLDAVCLVLKASQNRISERLCYIFEAILALFGKDIERNVVLFITHTDRLTVDFLEAVEKEKILCCHNAENEPVHFLFNNTQSVIQTAKSKQTIKLAWEMGQSSMKRFLDFLKSRQRKGLTMRLLKTTYSPLTLCYLALLIPRVEEAGEEEWAQKLKELQKRKISSFSNESSALNHLMQKSTELSSGPPAVRHLHTTRSNLDESGKIRKWTFGQQNVNVQNKTILLVGETGTGKTTLINTMTNYYLGVKFEDNVWFEITEEEKRDQTESKLSEITVYEIISEQKPESLTIIDTPGFGDTRGLDKDTEIPQNLHELFLHDTVVKSLDAVCLVLKASQNRISDRQRYIFDAILSLLGKDIGENIVLFITHSDGSTPINALKSVEKEKIPCCHDAENQPVHFLFNNRQSEIQTAKTNRAVKMGWEMCEKSLQELFEFLKSRERKGLIMTVNVLQERMQLDACVQNLKEHVFYIEAKQRELAGVQNALKQNKEKIEKNGNHSFTVRRVYKEKVDVTGASWWGQQANKYEIREKMEKVTFNELNKYSKKNDVTYDESAFRSVKTELEQLLKIKEEMMNIESSLKKLLTEKEKERNSSVKEAYEAIIKLSEVALKPDSAFTLQYLDFLIPRVEDAGEAEWAQKLKNLQKSATTESTTSTVIF